MNEKNDYKVMVDMLNEAKEQYELFKNLLEDGYKQDEISLTRSKFLFSAYSLSDIDTMDDELSKEMLEKIRIPLSPELDTNEPELKDSTTVEDKESKDSIRKDMDEWVYSLCEDYYNASIKNENDSNESFESYYKENYGIIIRSILSQMKKEVSSLEDSENDIKKLEDETSEVATEYMNFMCSPEFEERKYEQLTNLKSKLETIEDEVEYKKMEKMISSIEKVYDLSFLTARLKRDPMKEAMSIVNTFFDDKRSSYVLSRCKEKLSKIGFNENIYRFFFNIEENYLPEEYHVFNNLFLFCVLRFISYININSKTDCSFARAIISSMSKLIYEKFTDKKREEFILFIEDVLSYFNDYHDKFERDNLTQPNHPRRIEKDKEHEKEEREMMIKTLKLNNIEAEFESMDSSELKEFYKKTLDEIEDAKEKEKIKDLEEFIKKTKPDVEIDEES